MADSVKAEFFRSQDKREFVIGVVPPEGHPFGIALTLELERAAMTAARLRAVLVRLDATLVEQTLGPGAKAWMLDAAKDEDRLAYLLERLDSLFGR